jgi:hypothetical protein
MVRRLRAGITRYGRTISIDSSGLLASHLSAWSSGRATAVPHAGSREEVKYEARIAESLSDTRKPKAVMATE